MDAKKVKTCELYQNVKTTQIVAILRHYILPKGTVQGGGDNQQRSELSDKSLKPVLDRLDKMFQKLEDKLQTGVPVKVS